MTVEKKQKRNVGKSLYFGRTRVPEVSLSDTPIRFMSGTRSGSGDGQKHFISKSPVSGRLENYLTDTDEGAMMLAP